MRFLLEVEKQSPYSTAKLYEAEDKIKVQTLSQAKDSVEKEQNLKYDALETDAERTNFIQACINKLKNAENIDLARSAIIDAIKESNWNNQIVDYITGVANLNVPIYDTTIDLVSQLIREGKIDWENSKTWLLNKSLYDRPSDELEYSIKALTLASNPALQEGENGGNKFFDSNNPLTVEDLMDNGRIVGAAKIQDILNNKQTKDFNIKQSPKQSQKPKASPREWLRYTLNELKKSPVEELIDKYYKEGDDPVDTLQRMYDNGFKL